MPHLSGVFDEFGDLDKVSIEEIEKWLSQKMEEHAITNFLGNRILYPQAIPLTHEELDVDLAILREAIKLKPSLVYEPQTNKIVISRSFIERFPPASKVARAVIEGLEPKGLHNIFIRDKGGQSLIGSVISPLNPQKLSTDEKTVMFTGLAIRKALPLNAVSFIPTPASDVKIMLGGEEFRVSGGEAGIIIDLRLGKFV